MSAPAQAGPAERKFAGAPRPTVSEDGRFVGYASLFGRADLSGDIVERGAFRASLARRGAAGVKLLFQHDPHRPVGRWLEVLEDVRGLRVAGALATGTSGGREVMDLMRAGLVDGLSIGFRTVRSRPERGGGRRLLEIDLWEVSIVTFPMLPEARLEAAKSALPSRPCHEDEGFGETRLIALMRRGASDLRQTRNAR